VDKLRGMKPQEYIDAVNAQAGSASSRIRTTAAREVRHPSYRWETGTSQLHRNGPVDLMTDWQSQLDREDVSMEVYTEFEDWLSGPRIETLKRWDQLNLTGEGRRHRGIDNHKYKKDYNGQTLEIFPYETAFKTITNHILLDKPLDKDFKKAKKQVLEAVKHGALYVSFDWWDDPTDFSFEVDNGKKIAGMGDTSSFRRRRSWCQLPSGRVLTSIRTASRSSRRKATRSWST